MTDPVLVSGATHADLLAALLEMEMTHASAAWRAAVYHALALVRGREPDVRRLYGWTRKRWVRERRRYNSQRGWKAPWSKHVQERAAAGDPPWYQRNTPETRALRRRLR